MQKKERVIKTIQFDNPDRIPIWHFNRDQLDGDILSYELSPYRGGKVKKSEWGFEWENLGDGTVGQPKEPIIQYWDILKSFEIPNALSKERFNDLPKLKGMSDHHYLIGELGITGFNTYTFLRGFQNAMMDFILDKKRCCYLLDKIFEFENQLIHSASEYSFDGIHFADDWGTQKNLMISPELWREIFKPRYKLQFDKIHNLGMQVWFHSCGNIELIVEDFHEIGVDVLNISQPNVVDINAVGKKLKGKQCFMLPISYQTISISGTSTDIKNEARRLFNTLGTDSGGFIGYVEDYNILGMSENNYQNCISAFKELI